MRLLKAVAALVALAALVAVVPYVLFEIGGIPSLGNVSWDSISQAMAVPDWAELFKSGLCLVAWVGWLAIVGGLAVEVAGYRRGIKLRVRGLGWSQALAGGLLTVIVAGVGTGTAMAATTPAGTPDMSMVAASKVSAPETPVAKKAAAQSADVRSAAYTVKAGDTLWKVATEQLGDGTRSDEIAKLNFGRVQPGGESLTHGNRVIKAGWTLVLPERAATVDDHVTVRPGNTLSGISEKATGDAEGWRDIYKASRDTIQPDGSRITNPNVIFPGQVVTIPATAHAKAAPVAPRTAAQEPAGENAGAAQVPPAASEESPYITAPATPDAAVQSPEPVATTQAPTAPAEPAPVQTVAPETAPEPVPVPDYETSAEAPADSDVAADTDEDLLDWFTSPQGMAATGLGAVLAFGLTTLWAKKRRKQQHLVKPGQQIPESSGPEKGTELIVAATADPEPADSIDRILRSLGAWCHSSGTPIPRLRVARLTAGELEMYFAGPVDLAEPWTATQDPSVWSFERARAADLPSREQLAADVASPYPALVTIGQDLSGGLILLDLEQLGSIAYQGSTEQTRADLAAVAIELATQTWADHLQITVVGGGFADLPAAMNNGLMSWQPTVGRLITQLRTRATGDRRIFAQDGAETLAEARGRGVAEDTWPPHIIILADDQALPAELEELAELVTSEPRVAIAAVTSGAALTEWVVRHVDEDSTHALLEPMGPSLEIIPQRIDAEKYGHILAISNTRDLEPEGLPDVTAAIEPDLDELAVIEERAVIAAELEAEAAELAAAAVEPEAEIADEEAGEGIAAAAAEEVAEALAPAADEAETDEDVMGVQKAPAAIDLRDTVQPLPRLNLLGPAEVVNTYGQVEQSKRKTLMRLAAYIALKPGCPSQAIEDDLAAASTRPARYRVENVNKLRSWFGVDLTGEPYVTARSPSGDDGHRIRCTTDWHDFRALVPKDAPLADISDEALTEALALVRGVPFKGMPERTWEWARRDHGPEMVSAITAAATELANRHLLAANWQAADVAASIGLTANDADETLRRLGIKAKLKCDREGLPAAIRATIRLGDAMGGLEDETEEVLREASKSQLAKPSPGDTQEARSA